jgi:hypothetical protein
VVNETVFRYEAFHIKTRKELQSMKPKRKPKTFAETVSQNLNRQQQMEAIKKTLLQKARAHRKPKKESNNG